MYSIHEESYAFTNHLAAHGIKPFSNYTMEEARPLFLSAIKNIGSDVEFDGQVIEISIPSSHIPDGIPATVYKPTKLVETPAIVVYTHGGSMVLLDRKCSEPALKIISASAGCIIVNVEYRLLFDPGKGLDPFDDSVVATKWVLENKEKVGGRPESKADVAGDSAGGQIAASVASDVHKLAFQILVFPNVDTSLSQASVKELPNVPGLTNADLEWFMDFIRQEIPDHLTNPRVNGIIRTNIELLPPTLKLLAQLDPLRDCRLEYSEKLRAAGVPVRIAVIEGVPHCFFGMCGLFKTKCQEVYGHIIHLIKEFQK